MRTISETSRTIYKRYNIQIIGVPEEEDKKKDHEKILEEIIEEEILEEIIFPSLKWGRK